MGAENSAWWLGLLCFVLTYLGHSTVLLALAWAADRPLRRRSAFLAEWSWKLAALLGLLTAFVQTTVAPGRPLVCVLLGERPATSKVAASDPPRCRLDQLPATQDSTAPLPSARDETSLPNHTPPARAFAQTAPTQPHVTQPAPVLADGSGPTPASVQPSAATRTLANVPATQRPKAEPATALAAPVRPLDSGRFAELDHEPSPAEPSAGEPAAAVPPDQPPVRVDTPNRHTASSRAADPSGPAVSTWLLLLVLAGGLVRLTGLGWSLVGVRSAGRPLRDARPRRLLRELSRRAGVSRSVELLETPALAEPCAWGIRTWRIVLPARLVERLPSDELRALLAHELAHLVRRDTWWLLVGRALCAACWFQPLNFLAKRRWHQAAEEECDDWAARVVGDRLVVARCLTAVLEWKLQRPVPLWSLAVSGRRSGELTRRVERLLEGSASRVDAATAKRGAGALTLFLAGTALTLTLWGPAARWSSGQLAPSATHEPPTAPLARRSGDGPRPGDLESVGDPQSADGRPLVEPLARPDTPDSDDSTPQRLDPRWPGRPRPVDPFRADGPTDDLPALSGVSPHEMAQPDDGRVPARSLAELCRLTEQELRQLEAEVRRLSGQLRRKAPDRAAEVERRLRQRLKLLRERWKVLSRIARRLQADEPAEGDGVFPGPAATGPDGDRSPVWPEAALGEEVQP